MHLSLNNKIKPTKFKFQSNFNFWEILKIEWLIAITSLRSTTCVVKIANFGVMNEFYLPWCSSLWFAHAKKIQKFWVYFVIDTNFLNNHFKKVY